MQAIRFLVASSVPGMNADQVSVIDQRGALLSDGATSSDMKAFQLQTQVEDRFRRALGEYYRQNPADDLPELTCDLRVDDPHLLTMACIESLDALEPCGNGNPKPLLCITGARLVNAVPIGGGRHLRLHFAKGGYNYAGIFFSCTPAELGVRIGAIVGLALMQTAVLAWIGACVFAVGLAVVAVVHTRQHIGPKHLEAPGPDEARHTAAWPVVRAMPWAIKPAPCS